MTIDLRSDTVTKPSQAMLEMMMCAPVGDDVFGEDPTVNELQNLAAEMFGMEAGLFCPTGTMANQIAIKCHTQPGDEVICETGAHVHYYEGGGIAFNSGASTNLINGIRGTFTSDQLSEALRPKNVHFSTSSLVCIENTCNRGGGKIFDYEELKKIKAVCTEYGLKLHLDGARLFNAIVAEGRDPRDFGKIFDSITICINKGLGAPVGSLLLGPKALIHKAVRVRKVFGGGMRQAGILAAAGIYALQHNIERIALDHELAKSIETALNTSPFVHQVIPVETNIVVFELIESVNPKDLLSHFLKHEIHAFEVGKQRIRFVTHLDLPSETLSRVKESLRSLHSA